MINGEDGTVVTAVWRYESIRLRQEERSGASCWNNRCIRVDVSCIAVKSCNLIRKTY